MTDNPDRTGLSTNARLMLALAVAAAFGLGVYALLESVRPSAGLISFSFLLILPAAICAFVSYLADLDGKASLGRYMAIPPILLLVVVVLGAVVLREGVICIILLAPLWLISGVAGVAATYNLRRIIRNGRNYCSVVLLAPLVAIQLEPHVPLPERRVSVVRSSVIEASPERIWPLLRGIPDVRPGEGAWNLSQDVIGVPRPLGARLIGEGRGATRLANWGKHVRFREVITEWQPGHSIGWRFLFDDIDGWRFTDRHLMPDSPYLRVESGGYRLQPIDAQHTRVTLHTTYWLRTPVNAYSAAWGELFLGDLETNLLALVRHRAES